MLDQSPDPARAGVAGDLRPADPPLTALSESASDADSHMCNDRQCGQWRDSDQWDWDAPITVNARPRPGAGVGA